jgi:flagellar biosynthesis protein FlhB
MMSGSSDNDDDKNLDATEKKLDDARLKGDVPRSQEVKNVAVLGGGLAIVSALCITLAQQLMPMFTFLLGQGDSIKFSPEDSAKLAWSVTGYSAILMGPILALMFGLAILGGLSQGRPTWSGEKLKLQWSKISPMKGLGRMFGLQGVIEFVKTLIKFTVVTIVMAKIVWPTRMHFEAMMSNDPQMMLVMIKDLTVRLFFAAVVIVLVIWVLDYVYQYQSFMKRMKMSRQDMKEEFKQSEGDPHIKAKLRQLRMERSRKRMMAAVPTADVVITNPTHYAVALKYEHGKMNAPKVVAKGVDSLAAKIREVATANDVPLMENPPLARALYATVDVDEDIKPEQYQAVAEVISAIMKLRKYKSPRLSSSYKSL